MAFDWDVLNNPVFRRKDIQTGPISTTPTKTEVIVEKTEKIEKAETVETIETEKKIEGPQAPQSAITSVEVVEEKKEVADPTIEAEGKLLPLSPLSFELVQQGMEDLAEQQVARKRGRPSKNTVVEDGKKPKSGNVDIDNQLIVNSSSDWSPLE